MEPVVFIPTGPADAGVLFDLFCRVRGHDLGAAAWPEAVRAATLRIQFDAQTRGYRERWPSADTTFLSAAGAPVGWAIVDRGTSAIRVVDIAIVPELRGRGLGTSALRSLQDEASRTARPLTLSVLRMNIPAIRLYSRLGFEATGADELHLGLTWQPPAAPPPAVSAPTPATAAPPRATTVPAFTPGLFRAALDTWFEVDQPGEPLLLPLREVDEHAPSGGFLRFSLIFHGPGDRPLQQGLHRLRHPSVGDHEIFLVPIAGSTPERMMYEATFSLPDSRRTP